MSEITTTVRLYSGVPFDSEHEHIAMWTSGYTQRDSYFENYLVKTITMPYFCVGDEFDIDIEYANIGVAPNYLSYTSHIYPGNKYFFIDTITQITDGKIVRLHCIMDWWQTYFAHVGYSAPGEFRFQLNKNYTRLIEGDKISVPDSPHPLIDYGYISNTKIPKLSITDGCHVYVSATVKGTVENTVFNMAFLIKGVYGDSSLNKALSLNEGVMLCTALGILPTFYTLQDGKQYNYEFQAINQILLIPPNVIMTNQAETEFYQSTPALLEDTVHYRIYRITSTASSGGVLYTFHRQDNTTVTLSNVSPDNRNFITCGSRQIEFKPLKYGDTTFSFAVIADSTNSQANIYAVFGADLIDLTPEFTMPIIAYNQTDKEYNAAQAQAYASFGLQAATAATLLATGNYLPAIGAGVSAGGTLSQALNNKKELSISGAPTFSNTILTGGIRWTKYVPYRLPRGRKIAAEGESCAYLVASTSSSVGVWYRFSEIMIDHETWNSTSDYYWRIPHKYVREFYAIAKRGFYLHAGGIYVNS